MGWCRQATSHYLSQCWLSCLSPYGVVRPQWVNTMKPEQNGHHFADDILKCILLNENAWLLIKIWLKFVPKGPINNFPALVQIMAWCRPGNKPLSEPMMVSLLMHICVTLPQWVNTMKSKQNGRHFAYNIFKRISWHENIWILNNISLKYFPEYLTDDNSTLVKAMAWCLAQGSHKNLRKKFHDFSMTSPGQNPNFKTKNPNICFCGPCIKL